MLKIGVTVTLSRTQFSSLLFLNQEPRAKPPEEAFTKLHQPDLGPITQDSGPLEWAQQVDFEKLA